MVKLQRVRKALQKEPAILPIRSLSVIVPCRGCSPTLLACLHSLRSQRVDLPVEIIVVINGRVFARPSESLSGCIYVHEPVPGPAAARNAGVRAATGDVFAFIDSDCVADPGWLAAALKVMREGASDCIIAGAITRSGSDKNWASLYDRATYLRQEDYVKGSGACVTANLVVHRTVFARIGPFDQAFTEAAFEDWEWSTRACRLGVAIVFAGDAVVDHPCMAQLSEVRSKAERLARGQLLMQHKTRHGVTPPRLLSVLCGQLRKPFRNPRLSTSERLRVMCIGLAIGFWGWKEARRHFREEM